jgi:hypothetical protein
MWVTVLKIGGLWWMRYWIFGFHIVRRIFWLGEELLVSSQGLCNSELPTCVCVYSEIGGGGREREREGEREREREKRLISELKLTTLEHNQKEDLTWIIQTISSWTSSTLSCGWQSVCGCVKAVYWVPAYEALGFIKFVWKSSVFSILCGTHKNKCHV